MGSDIATVPLLGGHPALDLVNTVAPREVLPDGSLPQDRLVSPAALLAWAHRAGFVDTAESELTARAWARDPGAGAAALDAVREVRDSLHTALLGTAGLVPQHPDVTAVALQRLHGRWVAAVARSALRPDRDASRPDRSAPEPPRLHFGSAPQFQVQDRIAAAVMDLLLTADYGRLRRCPPEDGGCGWIVLDQSRNGSRRWCQMADCGNAAKSRRLTERRRARRPHPMDSSSLATIEARLGSIKMEDPPIRARHVGALIALSVAAFAFVTTETLPIGLLSLISRGTHSSLSAAGLLVTYYGLVVVVVTVPLTQLTRQVPRRYLMSGLLAVFALATLGSALASSYGLLLASRIATALSQALFWSTVISTAAGLFPRQVRGRAVSLVFAGLSLASLLGVPAGTWLSQHFGWRSPFGALSCVALLTMLAVAWLLPTAKPGEGEAARGTAPDARRYWLTLAVVSLAVTGSFASFTYITPFLTQVSRFSPGALSLILLVRGIAGLAGVYLGGRMGDWNPWVAIGTPVAVQALALCALYPAGAQPAAAVLLTSLAGLSFSAMCTALTGRVLQVAPGSVDMATAGTSVAVNIGITAGALIGGLLLPGFGVRSTALAGGLLSIAALAAVFGELLLRPRPAVSPEPAAALVTSQHS